MGKGKKLVVSFTEIMILIAITLVSFIIYLFIFSQMWGLEAGRKEL